MAITNYQPDINGLRAFAVLAVVLHHLSASLMPGGYVGVDVLFFISGYLISRIISRAVEKINHTFARFYERRAQHSYPGLAIKLRARYFLPFPNNYLSR